MTLGEFFGVDPEASWKKVQKGILNFLGGGSILSILQDLCMEYLSSFTIKINQYTIHGSYVLLNLEVQDKLIPPLMTESLFHGYIFTPTDLG